MYIQATLIVLEQIQQHNKIKPNKIIWKKYL